MADYTIKAITESRPPVTDPITYLTILETHMSPEILPTLNEILQDAELTQSIGWDLIHLLLPMPGSRKCLDTIARLGNPREVVLKVTESMQLLDLDERQEEEEEEEQDKEKEKEKEKEDESEPSSTDKFCTLVNLLAILHPRIKTKNPSRFLSTSLMAILSAYRPSNEATLAVISFVHTISGKKRPSLPGRKSSLNIPVATSSTSGPLAPDPEAQDEDPAEAAIQQKLLQSFVTHVLEEYINTNTLEWAARLQEHFDPRMVVPMRKSLGETYKDDPTLVTRTAVVGQLVVSSVFGGIWHTRSSVQTDTYIRHISPLHPSSRRITCLTCSGSISRSRSIRLRHALRLYIQNGFASCRARNRISIFPWRDTTFSSRLTLPHNLLDILLDSFRVKSCLTEAHNLP